MSEMDLIHTWNDRAKKYGRRCVQNLAIPDAQFDAATERERFFLMSALKSNISTTCNAALDFGCGAGRFTPDLAALSEEAVGFDPSTELVEIAKKSATCHNLKFLSGSAKEFATAHALRFDLVFIANVLGGLSDEILAETFERINSMLKDGGTLFFAENTSQSHCGNDFWRFRSVDSYRELFPYVTKVGQHYTLGNEVSIFAGVKR